VVTAAEQSAGRGRQGRTWFAPPGAALLYSALLRPLGDRPLLPLAAPLAVCETAEEISQVRCGVKWPNDVWIGDRKLAGVLIESRAGSDSWAVIGVGLNVAVPPSDFPPELAGTATSLLSEGADDASVAAALTALNDALGRWVDAPREDVLDGFRARDALTGRHVSWSEGEGVVAGIDDSGHLLVDTGGGNQATLGAGEVHLKLAR
jgi:BirA family transcriptional regulator, biotin operon repressor / biotin---[acetyl-CoA-carboxylase] ligase